MTDALTTSHTTAVQHLDMPPVEADAELLRRVTSASNSRVAFTRKSNGKPGLHLRSDADASHLHAARMVIGAAMESGPQFRVSAALTRLTIVCHKPKRIGTEEAEALWFETMTKAMMDYPLDVVQWAFEEWRKTPDGEWWPAEAEIRRLCERAVDDRRTMLAEVERAIRELRDRHTSIPAPRRYDGKAAEFMARARERCTRSQVLCYFSKYGMRIDGATIWVKNGDIYETMVRRLAGDIADELGMEVRRCQKIPSSFPDYDGPPPTEAERAGMVAGLRALSRAVSAPKPRNVTEDTWQRQIRDMADHARSEAEQRHS